MYQWSQRILSRGDDEKGKLHSDAGSSAQTIRLISRDGGSPSSENDLVSGLQFIIYSAILTQVRNSSSVKDRVKICQQSSREHVEWFVLDARKFRHDEKC